MYDVELNDRYFNWLVDKIDYADDGKSERYKHLIQKLHYTDYSWVFGHPLDSNRYQDGINLRYRFGDEKGIDRSRIREELDIYECSMLEMLVALAIRVEESGMGIPYEGIHPGRWFWLFVENIGYFKAGFDDDAIDDVTERFLKRQYNPDGSNGGIVVVPGNRDLRLPDIWYQVNLYLSTLND